MITGTSSLSSAQALRRRPHFELYYSFILTTHSESGGKNIFFTFIDYFMIKTNNPICKIKPNMRFTGSNIKNPNSNITERNFYSIS